MATLIPADILHTFCDSFERVKKRPDFFDVFMENFLASSDEVAKLFENVSFARLRTLLQASLYWPMLASDGNQSSIERLMVLGKFHTNKGAKIEHYDLWLDSMMRAVAQCDKRFNLEVDQSWRMVMSFAISIMTSQPKSIRANRYCQREAESDEIHAEEEE